MGRNNIISPAHYNKKKGNRNDTNFILTSKCRKRVNNDFNNLLVVGSYKDFLESYLEPNILEQNSSMIIIDSSVDGEYLYDKYASYLKEKDANVQLLNLTGGCTAINLDEACTFNPLNYVYKEDGTLDLFKVECVIDHLCKDDYPNRDPFLGKATVSNLLHILLCYLLVSDEYKKEERNLITLGKMVSTIWDERSHSKSGDTLMDKIISFYESVADAENVTLQSLTAYYDTYKLLPDKYFLGIIADLQNLTDIFTSPFAKRLFEPAKGIKEVNIPSIGSRLSYLFIRTGDVKNQSDFAGIESFLLAEINRVLFEYAEDNCKNTRENFLAFSGKYVIYGHDKFPLFAPMEKEELNDFITVATDWYSVQKEANTAMADNFICEKYKDSIITPFKIERNDYRAGCEYSMVYMGKVVRTSYKFENLVDTLRELTAIVGKKEAYITECHTELPTRISIVYPYSAIKCLPDLYGSYVTGLGRPFGIRSILQANSIKSFQSYMTNDQYNWLLTSMNAVLYLGFSENDKGEDFENLDRFFFWNEMETDLDFIREKAGTYGKFGDKEYFRAKSTFCNASRNLPYILELEYKTSRNYFADIMYKHFRDGSCLLLEQGLGVVEDKKFKLAKHAKYKDFLKFQKTINRPQDTAVSNRANPLDESAEEFHLKEQDDELNAENFHLKEQGDDLDDYRKDYNRFIDTKIRSIKYFPKK